MWISLPGIFLISSGRFLLQLEQTSDITTANETKWVARLLIWAPWMFEPPCESQHIIAKQCWMAGGKWRTILPVLILSSESDGIWRKRNNEFFKQSRFSHLAGGVTLQVILETQNELPRSEGWATNVRIRSTTQSNRTKPAKVKTHLASEPLIWKVMEIII